jgi:D-sedoheptulose 7-phosphate isomerase
MVHNSLVARLQRSIQAKQAVIADERLLAVFDAAAQRVVEVYRAGGRLYIAGNGGSAADAQHLAAEFVSRLARDRAPLPAEALTVDTSVITAISNDYGYQHVFSRQLKAKARAQDIFLGITTSGNSQNILEALNLCREENIPSLLFTGADGGKCKSLATYAMCVPIGDTATIQEVHIALAHALCAGVEDAIFA